MKPLISVIMCTYNEKKEELEQSIDSMLNQTYEAIELLIVLDNPDNSMIRDLVNEYAQQDKRVCVLINEKNQGVAKSSNRAWRVARGEYLAKMDGDDIAMPHRLELELQVLREKELDLVAASKRNVDEEGGNLGVFINDLDPNQLRRLLPYDNLITQSTVLMKKAVMDEIGGYMDLPSCEDYDLWLRILHKGYRMAVIPQVLVNYRVRRNSITRTNYYKQYLSDCFVRRMYQKYKKGNEVWSLEDYQKYVKRKKVTEKKKQSFNASYQLYYKGMEERKQGRYDRFLLDVLSSIWHNPYIFGILIRKLLFHIRKKWVLCKWV